MKKISSLVQERSSSLLETKPYDMAITAS